MEGGVKTAGDSFPPRQGRPRSRTDSNRARHGRWAGLLVALGALALGGLIGAQTALAVAPVASFTASPNPAQIGQTIDFDGRGSVDDDGDALTYAWDLDNDNQYDDRAGPQVNWSYGTSGNKSVKLRVSDGSSSDVAVGEVHVNAPPTSSFTASPNPTVINTTVTFNGAGSSDSDGSIVKFEWDVDGDGSFEASGATATTTTSYGTLGTRNVKLRVTDNTGAVSPASSVNVDVVNSPPVAKIAPPVALAPVGQRLPEGQNPFVPIVGQPVGFLSLSTDLETPPAGLAYAWVDAVPLPPPMSQPFSTKQIPDPHPGYPTAGDHLVALHVTDENGASADAVATVRINTPPKADFVVTPQTPVINEPITFFQAASDADPQTSDALPNVGALVKFEWDFDGDGSFEKTGQQVAFSYASSGPKNVRMRVTDGGGARSVVTKTLEVAKTRPKAAFAFGPSAPQADETVTFTSTSSPTGGEKIVKQEWDFDFDPKFDPTKDKFSADVEGGKVIHSFSAPGEKLVALKVTESGGGYDIATHTVVVRPSGGAVLSGKLSVIGMTVQISGRTTKRGAKLRLLQVRTPVGAMVKLTCKGRRCPIHSKRVEAKQGRVRFKKFERKLRAGTKIILEATMDGFIGKRVVFKIRKGKAPLRRDRCLQPGASRASACPG